MHTYKHTYTLNAIHTYIHVRTNTYIHIYTHTYNMYICMHASTPERRHGSNCVRSPT